MIYTFSCANGHTFEQNYPIREFTMQVRPTCPDCCAMGRRDLAADIETINTNTGDPWRRYHLSARKEHEQAKQERYIEGPTDNFERKRMEKELGRVYIGDDTAPLKPKVQKAIALHKERVKAGEVAG